jgi:phosphoglycolate phosphatase
MREDIFARIKSLLESVSTDHAVVIGINGVDTSGKTTFAIELERYLQGKRFKTQLIHLDNFHNPRSVRSQGDDPIQSYLNHAFNLELLENQILAPARKKEVIDKELLLLNLESDTFTNRKAYRIDQDTVVILEGVLLYREPLDQYFNVRVFLDIPFSEVLRRAGERDAARFGPKFLDKYRTKYIPLQKRYLERYSPKEHSDIVVDNSDYLRPTIIQQ